MGKTAECKESSINDEKALCVFVHNTEDKNVEGLKALATKGEKSETLFFYATAEAPLVLLDLDDDGAYYLTNTSDVSEAALAKFLKEPGPPSSSSRRDFVKPYSP